MLSDVIIHLLKIYTCLITFSQASPPLAMLLECEVMRNIGYNLQCFQSRFGLLNSDWLRIISINLDSTDFFIELCIQKQPRQAIFCQKKVFFFSMSNFLIVFIEHLQNLQEA